MMEVQVVENAIFPSELIEGAAPDCGAEAWFIGKVRDHREGRKVVAVEYDAFPPLAERTFWEIAYAARARWGDRLRLKILHRRGRLSVGEISVLIRIESPHRAEAFAACRFVIEEIKTRAPIWKKEIYHDGESEWVQGHALCGHGGSHGSDGHCSGGGPVLPHGS